MRRGQRGGFAVELGRGRGQRRQPQVLGRALDAVGASPQRLQVGIAHRFAHPARRVFGLHEEAGVQPRQARFAHQIAHAQQRVAVQQHRGPGRGFHRGQRFSAHRCAEMARQQVAQCLSAQRLGGHFGHAGGQAALTGVGKQVGGERQDADLAGRPGQRADRPGGGHAVHRRHVHVHQHQIQRRAVAAVGLGLHHLQRCQAVVDQPGMVAQPGQQRGHVELVDRVVFGDQHLQRPPGGPVGCQAWCGRRCHRQQRAAQAEHAARARRAAHRDLATHQARQVTRNRQPQAGAALTPCNGAFGPAEAAEQPRDGFAVHADAGVGNIELEHRRLALLRQQAAMQHDGASLRVLDRVGEQVEQQLAHAGRVKQHRIGQGRVERGVQGQALGAGGRLQQRAHLAQQQRQHDR